MNGDMKFATQTKGPFIQIEKSNIIINASEGGKDHHVVQEANTTMTSGYAGDSFLSQFLPKIGKRKSKREPSYMRQTQSKIMATTNRNDDRNLRRSS